MGSPVQIPKGVLTNQALDNMVAGDYFVHALSTDTKANGSRAGRRVITYAGGALAIVLSAPVKGSDDGKLYEFLSTTDQAHTITCTGHLFDGNGHSNTITFAAHKGANCILEAYQGNFYLQSGNQATGS